MGLLIKDIVEINNNIKKLREFVKNISDSSMTVESVDYFPLMRIRLSIKRDIIHLYINQIKKYFFFDDNVRIELNGFSISIYKSGAVLIMTELRTK